MSGQKGLIMILEKVTPVRFKYRENVQVGTKQVKKGRHEKKT